MARRRDAKNFPSHPPHVGSFDSHALQSVYAKHKPSQEPGLNLSQFRAALVGLQALDAEQHQQAANVLAHGTTRRSPSSLIPSGQQRLSTNGGASMTANRTSANVSSDSGGTSPQGSNERLLPQITEVNPIRGIKSGGAYLHVRLTVHRCDKSIKCQNELKLFPLHGHIEPTNSP